MKERKDRYLTSTVVLREEVSFQSAFKRRESATMRCHMANHSSGRNRGNLVAVVCSGLWREDLYQMMTEVCEKVCRL